jgi:type II secretory pathway predicted ATPase ExeA/DNA-binding Xre family transcriptional regulator
MKPNAKPWWAVIIDGELSRKQCSLSRLADATGVSKPTLSRLFAAERAPHQADALKAIIKELQVIGVQNDAVVGMQEWILESGGPARQALESLIKDGIISEPSTKNLRLSIQEASEMHEILTDDAMQRYGIPMQPFDGLRGPADVYMSPENKALTDHLIKVVTSSTSLAVLVGPTGSGKTTMMKMVTQRLKNDYSYRVLAPSILDMSQLNEKSLHRLILDAAGRSKETWGDPQKRSQKSQSALKSMGQRVVLIVDQAEDLTPDGILLLKRVNEWTDGGWDLLLRVVISGQPQIKAQFENERNRQFTIRADINEMPALKKAWPLVEHRLKQIGMSKEAINKMWGTDAREALELKAAALAVGTQVTPRAIENIAARAINWAAKFALDNISPDAIERVQDKAGRK